MKLDSREQRSTTTIHSRQQGGDEMRHAIDQWLSQTKPGGTFRSSFGSSTMPPHEAVKWNDPSGSNVQTVRRVDQSTASEQIQSRATKLAGATESNSPSPSTSRRDASTTRLSGLLKKVRFFSGSDIEFTSIAQSAETCEPGQLVVYRLGDDCPVELISQALARGAAGILTEQILPAPVPQAIVADTDRALAEIRSKQTDRPDQKLITIGIVGSAGKTVTAFLTASVLRDIPCRVAYQTDLGSSDSVVTEAGPAKATNGASLIDALSDAVDAGAAVSITEMDSTQLRLGAYDQIELDIVVVTGRDAGSNDFGPSPIECAFELVTQGGVLIVPESNQHILSAAHATAQTQNIELVTYGVDNAADVSIRTISHEDGTLTAMLRHESRAAVMESFLGRGHFAECLAAAAAVGVVTENPLPQIAESLCKLRDLPGRFEAITTDDWETDQNNPAVRLDIGGTPERVKFALQAARKELLQTPASSAPMTLPMHASSKASRAKRPKLWCVLAVSEKDDADTLMQYGRLLETMPDHCVLTCVGSDKAHFLSMSHGVLDGIQDVAAMRLVADPNRAIQWAHGEASHNDMILVIGGIDRRNPDSERRSLDAVTQVITACAEEREQALQANSQPAISPSLPDSGLPNSDLHGQNLPGQNNGTDADPPQLKLFDGN
ncbi:biogenesis of cell wall (cell envelope) [Rhodopirellula islandica]|uniref:Biogenesis of cell wall (Cell envelope) n=1 Tax=Rhodopirellula islandica TaxID=595434 RepID=A0A0J1BI55_RHOIS|nr:Mur ligase family protein [Rhodopirellula islandica]KLU06241.1 biogenesis of cell wall (cell envelope) [Rhodopirellula islandica]